MGRNHSFGIPFGIPVFTFVTLILVIAATTTSRNPFPMVALAGSQVGLSPTSLSFGDEVEGVTSAAMAVQLTNLQTVPLTISSISIAGGDAAGDYASSATCPIAPHSLSAGQKCSIEITFTPLAVGVRTASLTIADSASTSSQSVALKGTGTAPLTLSANNRVFIGRMVGTTSGMQSVTLTNNLNTQLVLSSIVTSGNFAVANNTCGSFLSAAQQCSIGVTFTPTALGPRQGTLTISDTALGSPSVVALSGTGNETALAARGART